MRNRGYRTRTPELLALVMVVCAAALAIARSQAQQVAEPVPLSGAMLTAPAALHSTSS